MGCCGHERKQVASVTTPVRRAEARAGPRSVARAGGVALRPREPGPVVVRGPVTGRAYELSAGRPVQIDPRDAEILLRTGRFTRG